MSLNTLVNYCQLQSQLTSYKWRREWAFQFCLGPCPFWNIWADREKKLSFSEPRDGCQIAILTVPLLGKCTVIVAVVVLQVVNFLKSTMQSLLFIPSQPLKTLKNSPIFPPKNNVFHNSQPFVFLKAQLLNFPLEKSTVRKNPYTHPLCEGPCVNFLEAQTSRLLCTGEVPGQVLTPDSFR